ncbi:MAG: nitroreductase family protein [bacterium]
MDLYDGLMTLKAIRRYTDEPVTEDEIQACLKAAIQAPNGGNIQPWQFLVITDSEVKRGVGEIYRRAFDRYEPRVAEATPPPRNEEAAVIQTKTRASARYLADNIGSAPALVAFLMPNITMTLHDEAGDLDIGTPFASIYPAVQNFMLAARSMGIGTTLTTVYRIYQQEVRDLLSIPERYEIIALVPMGRPKGHFGVAPRRPVESVTHWNTFGSRRTPPG